MKYIVQRDKGFPVDDNPRFAFGETFEPDNATTAEMCAVGVESGYLAIAPAAKPPVATLAAPQPAAASAESLPKPDTKPEKQ